MRRCVAEDVDPFNGKHGPKRQGMGPRHASRADEAQDFAVGSGEVLGSNAASRRHSNVLHDPIVDDGQGFRVACAEQKHNAAVGAGLHAKLLLRGNAIDIRLGVPDVAFHAYGKDFARGKYPG